MRKSRLTYILLLAVSTALVYNYPNKYFAVIFYLLLMIPFLSLLNLVYVMARFKISHEIDTNRVVKGDRVVYTCSIHNEDLIPYPEIKVVFEGEHILFHDQLISPSVVLMPKSHFDIDISLSCKYRGLYNIGVKYIEITDYFNLFKIKFKNFSHKKILVYPKILFYKNLHVNRIGNLENGIKDKRKILTNQSLAEIKNFEQGEKLSLIHWKLSAKMGRLMSKKMESITDEKYTVFIDLFRSDLGYEENIVLEDKLIEMFVAFINIILANNIPFDLRYMQIDGYREEKYSIFTQFEFFYERAANMQFSKSRELHVLLKEFEFSLSETSLTQGKLFIFTFNLTLELLEILEVKVMQGYSVFMFFVSPKELLQQNIKNDDLLSDEDELLARASQLGIKIYSLDISDSITNLLEGEVI
jgi:hypothetical protein